MVNLIVKDGKIRVMVDSDDSKALYQEVSGGISELLVEYQLDLLRLGYPREQVDDAFQVMIGNILAHNAINLNTKIKMITGEPTIPS